MGKHIEISISNIYSMLGGLYDVFGAIWIPHRFRIPLDSGDAFISKSFWYFIWAIPESRSGALLSREPIHL
jgi:hypothetical protein